MLYGWGFTPAFLASPTLNNWERGGSFAAKEDEICFGHHIIAMIV